jgi:hypothetical protein
MATKMVRLTQWITGEVDEITWKRTDVDEYLTSAQSLLNCEIGTTGLAKKRKGTSFLVDASDCATLQSVMYEFVDKNQNYYIILMGDYQACIYTVPDSSAFVVTRDADFVVTSRGSFVVAFDDTLSHLMTILTPYPATALQQVDFTQDNDSLILSHPDYPPGRIYIRDYATLDFFFAYLNIYPLPAYDFNTINYNGFTVTLSAVADTLTFAFSGVGNPEPNPGFTNAWIGGQIIGGGATEIDPVGYAIIQSVSYSTAGSGTYTFTALIQIAFLTTGYATQGSQYSVRQPAWVNTPGDPYGLGYPAKVLYFQNRLWFANTKLLPTTVFGSKINQPISFDVGTGRDTNAIIYTIGQTNSGPINWLNGGKQLEIFSLNFEFSCPQNENSGLTPSTFSIRQQSAYGSSRDLKPQNYINDTYFAAKTGKALINYHFTGVGLSYRSANISLPSSHLVKNPNSKAILRGSDTSQDNFIYFLNPDDSTLTAFQFALEFKLAALTPVVFQENVTLVDIVTVDNQVYILKYYDLTGIFAIEVFNPLEKIDSAEIFAMESTGIVAGLERFNGYTVQVVYENQDFGQYEVIGGTITVNNPDEIADNVQIGLLYDVEIKPMYPFIGSAAAPFFKNLSRIYVDYYQSLNFRINGKLVAYQNFQEIQEGLPLVPKTGTEIFAPVSGWQRFDGDAIVITQTSPFDLQILGISYQIESAVI